MSSMRIEKRDLTSPPVRREMGLRRKFNQLLQGYIVTDVLALMLGVFCAWNLAAVATLYRDRSVEALTAGYDIHRMLAVTVISLGALLWFHHKGHYRVRINFWLELKNVLGLFSVAVMADGFFQFATKQDFSRLWLISGWLFAALFILSFRGLYRFYLRRQGLWHVPTLLVGGGQTAEDTRAALLSERGLGFEITAHVKNLPAAFLQAGRSWETLCALHQVDYIVIALDGSELEKAEQSIAQLMRESVPFSISPPRRNLPILDMVPQYFFNSDVKLLTHTSGLEQPLLRLVKRSFDVAVSGTLLLITSPLFALMAWLITRDGGPAIFGHTRIGRQGRAFACLKFRSMVANSQEVLQRHLAENPAARAEWEETQKLKDDPRVTAVGDFLRRSSLDELPQLLNVFKGEMSLVGPRPIVVEEIKKYDCDIAHYYRVTPGITGLWQVSGRNDVTYQQRVQMDSWYVRNWSLWHDIAILCKTVPALMKRSGAY